MKTFLKWMHLIPCFIGGVATAAFVAIIAPEDKFWGAAGWLTVSIVSLAWSHNIEMHRRDDRERALDDKISKWEEDGK